MKPRKLGKKLALSKTTIVNLVQKEQRAVKGGYHETEFFGGCPSWHPNCETQPEHMCDFNTDFPDCLEPSRVVCIAEMC